ncbi:MAG: hypothetical protein RDU20_23460 [Desulfomonilaceae bacterium]|nr:hypothetical protein [Desulfomonilaceae bacterium]
MKRCALLLLVSTCFALAAAPVATSLTPQFGIGYDTTYVLCCGKYLNGKPFCTNMMHAECDTYNGKVVYDCSQCREAPAYTVGGASEDCDIGSVRAED